VLRDYWWRSGGVVAFFWAGGLPVGVVFAGAFGPGVFVAGWSPCEFAGESAVVLVVVFTVAPPGGDFC
jgi:hypothetical protein